MNFIFTPVSKPIETPVDKSTNTHMDKPIENPVNNSEKKKKCSVCKIKLGLTGGIQCRCGETLCASHIAGDSHGCSFDYRIFAQSTLSKQLVIPDLISTGRLEKL
jgi:hypothetical protein